MKTNRIMLLGAALMAAACAKEIAPENNQNNIDIKLVPITFNAGGETGEDAGSKVVLGGENMKEVHWTQADKIKVFDGVSNELPAFNVISGYGTTSATISGKISETAEAPYFAMYPYQEGATFTVADKVTSGSSSADCYKGYISLTIPTEQKAVANSIDPAAFIGIAYSDNGKTFTFKNLTAFVKLQLDENDIDGLESVSFSSNVNSSDKLQDITGPVYGYFANANKSPQILFGSNMSPYATLLKPDKGWEANTDYYIAIRPVTMSTGFTITAKYSDGSCRHISTTQGPAIGRNGTLKLDKIPALTAGLPNDLYIAFIHGVLSIGGKTLKKSDFSAGIKLATATSAKFGLGAAANTINFYSQNENCNFILNGNIGITAPVAICSRYLDKPVSISTNSKYFQVNNAASGASLYAFNISFDCNSQSNGIFRNYSGGSLDNLFLDSCNFTNLHSNLVQMTQANQSFDNISITNCNIGFSVPATSDGNYNNAYLINSNQSVTSTNICLVNNIIYCKGGRGGTLFGTTVNNNTITNLNISNNTIVGIYPTTTHHYVMAKEVKNIVLKNNYFHLPNLYNYTGASNYLSIVKATTEPTDKSNVNKSFVYYEGEKTPTTLKSFIANSEENTALNCYMNTGSKLNIDWTNLTFECKEPGYGASR